MVRNDGWADFLEVTIMEKRETVRSLFFSWIPLTFPRDSCTIWVNKIPRRKATIMDFSKLTAFLDSLYEKEGTVFADIKANETSLVYWCLQYGENLDLLSPKETRDKIKGIIKQMCKRYE